MKMDLALNNLQRLICHKTQQTKPNQTKNQSTRKKRKVLRLCQRTKQEEDGDTNCNWCTRNNPKGLKI